MIGWFIGLLVYWFIGLLVYWLVGWLVMDWEGDRERGLVLRDFLLGRQALPLLLHGQRGARLRDERQHLEGARVRRALLL